MPYVDQLIRDTKAIKNYAGGILENISCLPSVLGNILGANIIGEFAAIALEGIQQNFIAIADNIARQFQQVVGNLTNKLTQVSDFVNSISKTVCGVESMINSVINDFKELAADMADGFKQSERCQFVGAQLGACIRAKVYNRLSGQIQRGIINSDLYQDLAFGKISALESINRKTDSFISEVGVPDIVSSFFSAEAARVSRARRQIESISGRQVFGDVSPRTGASSYRNYNFRNKPYTKPVLIIKDKPTSTPQVDPPSR